MRYSHPAADAAPYQHRGTATSEGRIEGFKMIRMNILGGNILYGFRMFWKWRLIFWTFAPLLMLKGCTKMTFDPLRAASNLAAKASCTR